MKVIEVIIVALIFGGAFGFGGYLIGVRKAEDRGREVRRIRRVRNAAVESLNKIEDLAAKYLDVMTESPLSVDVRREIRDFQHIREEIE